MDRQSQNNLPTFNNGGTTFLRTSFNGINALSGVGTLSIPFALSQGGWLSIILLLLIATVCWYTGVLLKRCMDVDNSIQTYPDIAHRAFGYKGRVLVSIFLYVELFLMAVGFLIVEGDNLDQLFPHFKLKLGGLKIAGKKGFVLLAALVILPTTWLRNLGALSYISVGGVFASIILICCVLWASTFDGVGFHGKGVVVNWIGMPTTLSLFTFCYGGHSLFPTLSSSMRDKNQFSKVLLVCYVVSTFTYGSMAILGYLMYGDHLKSQVTLNLPIKLVSTKVAIYTTLIFPLTKYAVMITPIATAIEDLFPFHRSVFISIIIRTTIVVCTAVIAITFPFFGYVMAFIGAFLIVTVSILLPCLCYLKINKPARRFGLELIIIIVILTLGSFVGIFGTYTSIAQIVKHF